MNWHLAQKLRKRLEKETGACIFPPGARTGFALAFPNTYELGMSNLGLHIIYREINARHDMACERFFLPSPADRKEYEKTNTPLLSLETQRALNEFGLIGFAVSFEADYFHVMDMLALGRVEVSRRLRQQHEPIVIAGGPCATFNPVPLSDVVDAFVIGEGEEIISELLDVYVESSFEGITRQETIAKIATVDGVYVPGHSSTVKRRWVKNINKYRGDGAIETPDTEFGKMQLIEVARGCGRHCRFCMAGFSFRPPRARSVDSVVQAASRAVAAERKLGLVGAAVSDFPEMEGLCEQLEAMNAEISVASLRADSTTESLIGMLKASGHKTITLAPEAGSERLRKVINKGIDEPAVMRTVKMAVKAGIPNVKLYFMIGLPFEEDEDVLEICEFAERVLDTGMKNKGLLTLSINPFIPKPFTPFQWMPMADYETLLRRTGLLNNTFKKYPRVRVSVENIKDAVFQSVLARGDELIAKALLMAHGAGGRKEWRRTLNSLGVNEAEYTTRFRGKDERFPWEFIDIGISREYLWQEYEKAQQEIRTIGCFSGCHRCGVCAVAEQG